MDGEEILSGGLSREDSLGLPVYCSICSAVKVDSKKRFFLILLSNRARRTGSIRSLLTAVSVTHAVRHGNARIPQAGDVPGLAIVNFSEQGRLVDPSWRERTT